MKQRAQRNLTPRPEAVLEGRLRLTAGFIILAFLLFGVRLFQLQIVEGELLRERSDKNRIRTLRLEAPRGRLLDRAGRVLATTRPAFGVEVVPSDLQPGARTLEMLGVLLDRDAAPLAERVAGVRGARRNQPLRLADDLDYEHLARVESHSHALPGVVTAVRPRRHYPEGSLAAHLLGSIGEIGKSQLASERFRGYRSGEVIGQSGLEARLERHLRGRAGGRNVVVDVAGRERDEIESVSPVPGGTAVLTLDLELQRAAEVAFDGAEPPGAGAAVALDVRSGDVLALVSRPAYDPNAFAGGIDPETWQQLTTDEWKPLTQRAIQSHYPPGSTYKAMVAVALLEEGIVERDTRVFCPGHFRHGRRTYRCWKRGGHGWVDLRLALKRSCDVYFYQHGVKLGIDGIAKWARALGLGARTGIALPNEIPGLVPSKAWKERALKEVWYPGETVSASIGQGYNLTTPLQLAVAYAAIANGGAVLRPRILLRLESRDGRALQGEEPEVRSRATVSAETLALVRDGLEAVVMETGGTGGRARVPGMRVAGKTGTTQVVRLERTEGLEEDEVPVRQRDHAWFAAFAPVEDPQIAVAVFVEHGKHGSSAAAPIAQAILARWAEQQRELAPPAPGLEATGPRELAAREGDD